jgi:hypothetical protein
MPFAEDLLKQAFLLLNKESKNPAQASLRRSVSTAYRSFCQLEPGRHTRLSCAGIRAQNYEAGMRLGENATYDPATSPQVIAKLRSVARAFRELQLQRHLADYSNATKMGSDQGVRKS